MENNNFVDYIKLLGKIDSIRKIRMMHLFRTLGIDLDNITDSINSFNVNINKIPDLSRAGNELLNFRCLSKTKLSQEELKTNIEESQKYLDSLEEDDSRELFETFTSADETLFADMESSIPHDEYENYKKIISKILNLNLSFNFDLHIDGVRTMDSVVDYSNLSDLDFYDKIGQIVDSIEFNRACNTEDKFVLSECQRLLEMIEAKHLDDEEVAHTYPAKVLKQIAEKLKSVIEERSGRLNSPANQGYQQIENLIKNPPPSDPDPSDFF